MNITAKINGIVRFLKPKLKTNYWLIPQAPDSHKNLPKMQEGKQQK